MTLLHRRARIARPARRPRRGMSLVEIIVAMTLLAIVLSTLAYLAGQSSLRARGAASATYRAALGGELASRFSAMPYDSLATYLRTDTVSAGNTTFTRRVAMSDVAGSTVTKQLRITVVQNSGRRDSTITYVYRARPSLENVLNTP